MIYFINYANNTYKNAQKYNTKCAKEFNLFDHIIECNEQSISTKFRESNSSILNVEKGAGLWLWKPYIIEQTFRRMSDGDVLFYSDSGSHFIKNPEILIQLLDDYSTDLVCFEMEDLRKEAFYTKRDAFHYLDCDDHQTAQTNQRLGGFIILKKTQKTVHFVKEYLSHCCDERIISDNANVCGFQNYEGFIEHRHDQSVFSLLSKKYNFQAFRDPSQWGNDRLLEYNNSSYPQIIELTRSKNPKQATLRYSIKMKIKSLFRFLWDKSKLQP